MIQLLDQKTLHRLKQQLNRYERLLQQRHALDRQLDGIMKELGRSDRSTARPPSHAAAKNLAISRAMKRVWAERRRKKAQAAAAATATKPRNTPAKAAPRARA